MEKIKTKLSNIDDNSITGRDKFYKYWETLTDTQKEELAKAIIGNK